MSPRARHRIILFVICFGIVLGIAQGLPDTLEALGSILGFH